MTIAVADRTGGAAKPADNAAQAEKARQQPEPQPAIGSAEGKIGDAGRAAAAESLRQTGEEHKTERRVTTFQVAKDLSDALKAHTLFVKDVDAPKFFAALDQYNKMTPDEKKQVDIRFKSTMGNQGILEYCEEHGSFKNYDLDRLRNAFLGKNTKEVNGYPTFVERTAVSLEQAIADGDKRRVEYNLKDLSPAEAKKVTELYGKDSNGNDLATAIEKLGNGSEWADKQEQKLGGLTPEIRLSRLKELLASDLAGNGALALTLLEHSTPADREAMNKLLKEENTSLATLVSNSSCLDTNGKKLANQYLRPDYAPSPEQTAEVEGKEPAGGTKKHHIERGENLSVIAARYGVTVDQLMAVNPKINPTTKMIFAEKDLNLPDNAVDSLGGALAQK